MAKRGKTSNAAETARELRQDIYVYNEATGFIISSPGMKGKGYEPDDNKWKKAVEKGQLIPIELYQDDPFVVRVLVNGSLSQEEEREWLGKFTHKLKAPDGKVAIVGGIEYVMENFDNNDDDWIDDFVRCVDVPAGDYKADIYTFVTSVNGTPLLEETGTLQEPIGKFFRRTRAGLQFPQWLEEWLFAYSAEDPGHESEWQSYSRKEPQYWVDFLIHLTPLLEELPEPPALEMGFYNWTHNEIRKPEHCPLGVPVTELIGLPKEEEHVPRAVKGVDVFSWISDYPLTKLSSPLKLDRDFVKCGVLSLI